MHSIAVITQLYSCVMTAIPKHNCSIMFVSLFNLLQIKRQKKPGQFIKETSRHLKLEWVNKWPNSMITR